MRGDIQTRRRGSPDVGTSAPRAAIVLVALAAIGCGAVRTPGTVEPAPAGVLRASLPPIPRVTGPVELHVEYPDSLQRIAARDSNFIFGSVGTGDATLIIDGAFVEVEPNGTFLAWLPVPETVAGDTAWYRLMARRGVEADTLSHPVLLSRSPYEGVPGSVWVDTLVASEAAERWALPEERLSLSVRGAPGLEAWLEAGEGRVPLIEGPEPGTYGGSVGSAELHAAACSADLCDLRDEPVALVLAYAVSDGTDTARVEFEQTLRVLDSGRLPLVELREPPDEVNGVNRIVVGRPIPFGTYRWRFPEGTRAVVDGRAGDRLRLRLAPGLNAWVTADEAEFLPPGAAPPWSVVGDLRLETLADRIRLRIPLAAGLPLQMEEPDGRSLQLILFGARGNTDRVAHGPGSRVVESVSWGQLPGQRYRLTIRLTEPIWGYRTSYRPRGKGTELLLEIRRMPPIDPDRPLRGRRIAIDPGHPGAGAHGPSGYYEGDANLAIGRILARLLEDEGADPILIRTDTLPMGLYDRTMAAQEAGAELYVSIHNNALPDGVRPFGREGTSTYYYHPHSAALAAAVQEGTLRTMRLRDLGVYWSDLAVCRMAWMPSVLTEGAFMMHPSHEAALRDPGFQELYARGVLDGIRRFLGASAAQRTAR